MPIVELVVILLGFISYWGYKLVREMESHGGDKTIHAFQLT